MLVKWNIRAIRGCGLCKVQLGGPGEEDKGGEGVGEKSFVVS